ncbi:MAG: DNA repair protein RadA [Nitrospirae bacterium]|nr:MAG: DNA repair protein RadA [Nitrospirota bacterium]
MKPIRNVFVCQSCGYRAARWVGRCPDCGQWNTLKEEFAPRRGQATGVAEGANQAVPLNCIESKDTVRLPTGLGEFDRVLGGGIVPGSVILIGGDPGIGKTTLLLQVLPQLEKNEHPALYVSGEESCQQIKMRADRLGVQSPGLYVLAETSLEAILQIAHQLHPTTLVIDSIQTVLTEHVPSAPGSVSQVQEVACQLMWYAKRTATPVFIIGHVTKEGVIAGPKLLEHLVDTVLYFEGEKDHAYRILRAVKNRFGPTNEIGVFEMREAGLSEVCNPSALFLAGRPTRSPGSVVVPCMEGSRPILVELQALVTPTGYTMPKRMANGMEINRMGLLLAVMEKCLGLHLSGYDVYVNVVGGLHIEEPALDLGVVAAVLSSIREIPLETSTILFGEVGLGGEIRPVPHVLLRVAEAQKLGFQRCFLPAQNLASEALAHAEIELIGLRDIAALREHVGACA